MTTPVKYIGRRPVCRDGAYGSGLIFTQGETKLVPDDLATKLLRHADVYVPGDAKGATKPQDEQAKPKTQTEEEMLQDLRDTVSQMDKDALESYARTNFNVELDNRKSVASLRQSVNQMLDQYGPA